MYSLGIVTEAFLGIILTLDSWIYSLISSAYKIFMAIASARILSSDAYTAIANKVYVIVGVGMLFVLSYAIMKAIIDPDQMSKGDMAGGKILKSIAVAVIGLIVTPLLFDLAYMAQGKMLEDDILGKLFFRTGESTETIGGYTFNYDEELNGTGGAVAAVSVWQAFFYPADGVDPEEIIADPEIVRMNANIAAVGCAGTLAIGIAGAIGGFFTGGAGWVVAGAAIATCVGAVVADSNADKVEEAIDEEVTLAEAFSMVASGESFAIFQAFIEDIDEGNIKYTWFISTVCGAFVAYAFVSYAIDMGLRAAKLAYYQIIAPVPLILGVLPKNGDRVGKFAKAVMSTFLEVFVRISVVYIVIYIIAHLSELFSTVGALWDNDNLTNVESLIAMALLIIGLVLFAKQAPKIISDTFGLNAGNGLEGLNIMKKLRDGEVFTAGTIAGSTIRSGVQGAVAGWRRNDGKKFHQKLLGAAGSSIAGAASGGVRSGVGRARSGKPVGGFREMRDHVDRETRMVADKRKKREQFMKENPTMGAQARAIGQRIGDSAYVWAVGDTDTSYDDGYLALGSKLQKHLDDTRSVTNKDARVQLVKQRYDQLMAKAIGDYDEDAYAAAVKAANDAVEVKKANGEYSRDKRAFDAALSAEETRLQGELTAGRITRTQYDQMLQREKERLVADHLDTDKLNSAKAAANSAVDKEMYRYTAAEKAKAESKLIADRKAAKDLYESTQDAVFAEYIRDGDAAAVEVVSNFVSANINDLNKYAGAEYDGRKVSDILSDMGIGLDGSISHERYAHRGNVVNIVYKDSAGVEQRQYYVVTDDGYQEATLDPRTDEYIGTGATYTYQQIIDTADALGARGTGNTDVEIKAADSNPVKTKSRAKKGSNKKRQDPRYLADQARKRAEQEKKK